MLATTSRKVTLSRSQPMSNRILSRTGWFFQRLAQMVQEIIRSNERLAGDRGPQDALLCSISARLLCFNKISDWTVLGPSSIKEHQRSKVSLHVRGAPRRLLQWHRLQTIPPKPQPIEPSISLFALLGGAMLHPPSYQSRGRCQGFLGLEH
ncbi:uncharacterized protein B0I36DRAFT_91868 [Microdochium trichocladiopsis]|uniref:Uncharacterized protein n=1 Tax=Microdochium trichocladiopsis TaxID=1682393 RepID=A0A9P9BWS6_9PEZI|nr:uncharacterized protein B0I36DRAFT_91868 [Microdochium trichocladiopsis]KAH7035386.1 hypothetical protein B0I36DRAFT_91868 [Microdochium trichocladiopsis]